MKDKADLTEYLQMIENSFVSDSLIRIIIHPKHKSVWEKIIIRPVLIKNKRKLQATYRYAIKDEVKNYDPAEVKSLIDELSDNFILKTLFWETTTHTYLIEISKKGKVYFSHKQLDKASQAPVLQHNRNKDYLMPSHAAFLQDLGIASSLGKIVADGQRKYRQINKYIEILDKLIEEQLPSGIINIMDMGSGLGYLTFSLYYYLTRIKNREVLVKGIELRKELVDKCNVIASKYGYTGLTFEAGDINKMSNQPIDVLIALHACDIATDMAIAAGVKNDAKLIVLAPCCHKQVRLAMKPTHIQENILKHGILFERQAELLTDTIRGLWMEAHGYQTKIFEFISPEHTSKNLMITATKTLANISAYDSVQRIKANFGIDIHYLEEILPINHSKNP